MIDRDIVVEVDAILDEQVAQIYKDQPLAQDWARVSKVIEELGEVISEMILETGQNPRKGRDPEAFTRILKELTDTVMTGVYAIQHFTKDIDATERIMALAQAKHLNRLREASNGGK
jgi:hypothetical protein